MRRPLPVARPPLAHAVELDRVHSTVTLQCAAGHRFESSPPVSMGVLSLLFDEWRANGCATWCPTCHPREYARERSAAARRARLSAAR